MKKTHIITGAGAALVLIVAVIGIVQVNALTTAIKEQSYQQCVNELGGRTTSNPDEMIAIADRCQGLR